MNSSDRRGFTLVEAIVVVIVIAALLAVLIPFMREREREWLQVLAEAEPWEVFEFRVTPAKETFSSDEPIVLDCEIVNLTGYALTIPTFLDVAALALADTDILVALGGASWLIRDSTLGAGETLKVELKFQSAGVGEAEVRAVLWDGTLGGTVEGPEINYKPTTMGVKPSAFYYIQPKSGIQNHFRSNTFSLVVRASKGLELLPFDVLKEIKKSE